MTNIAKAAIDFKFVRGGMMAAKCMLWRRPEKLDSLGIQNPNKNFISEMHLPA